MRRVTRNRLPIENIDEWFDYVTFLETNYLQTVAFITLLTH